MKKLLTAIFSFLTATGFAQNVGIGTTTPSDQFHTTGSVRFEKYKGPATRMVQIDSSGRLVATAAGAVFSNVTPSSITDNGCATNTGVISTITVTGQPTAVQSSKIAVRVNITHTYDGDLKIYLVPPSGGLVLTLADGNGASGQNYTNTIFTDLALSSISTGTAPFTGQYKPLGGVLSCSISGTAIGSFGTIGFGTVVPNGNWTLRVFDGAGNDVGTLNSWSISFSGPESITTADEGNYIPKFNGGNLVASSIYQPVGSTNIGIGTTNPTAKLDINGQIKISGGTPGAGKYLTSDATGLASWYDASASFLPAGATGNTLRHNGTSWTANSLLYNNGTSIGIGTTSPNATYPLDINGRPRVRHNGATAGIWYNKADNTEASFVGQYNDSTFGFFGSNGWTSGFDVKNGQLGINNMDPTAPLSFASTTGNKIALWGDGSGGHYGMGIQASLLQIYSSASNADIAFGYGQSTNFNETMHITGTGKVGIGGITPTDYQLHVLGWPNSKLLQLENTDILGAGIVNTMMFQTGGNYTGAIKTIGESTTAASLGFYTGTSGAEGSLTRKMTIRNDGKVGIGITNPTTALLEVSTVANPAANRLMVRIDNRDGAGNQYSTTDLGKYVFGAVSQTRGIDASASGAVYNYGVEGFANAASGQLGCGIYGSSFAISGGTGYAGYFQGNVNYTGALTNTSDATLKTNIKPFENALTSISKLQIKQYEYTAESKNTMNTPQGEHIGLLAQDLQVVFPNLVSKQVQPLFEMTKEENGSQKRTQTGSKEYLGVNYMELIPVLIKGMQEQQVIIEELKKKIEVLEKK